MSLHNHLGGSLKKFDVRYEDESVIEHYEPKFIGDGLRYEISEFVAKIHHMGENAYKLTAGESIAITGIVEEFVRRKNVINNEMRRVINYVLC